MTHTIVCFIKVMGRHSGYIALHTGIEAVVRQCFLPESETNIDIFTQNLQRSARRQKLFNLVIVAEGNKSGDAVSLANRVREIAPEFDTKVTIIGHLQRGGSPSCFDRVLASRLGYHAVESLLAGKGGIIGVINDKIHKLPFEDAITKSKPLNTDLLKMVKYWHSDMETYLIKKFFKNNELWSGDQSKKY